MSEETIPQMRERIKELEKQANDAQSKLAEASAENRRLSAREAFRAEGYSPEHGELFAKSTDGDVSSEAINAFATQYGLQPAASGEETKESESSEGDNSGASDNAAALAAMSGGSSSSGSGGQQSTGGQKMTRQEYNEKVKSDPVAAREALMTGRVEMRDDNPWVANVR